MRFLNITYRTFGPFEQQTLDLTSRGGLQIVFGENEAGKSSALRGMSGFLFGFPGQSKDNFLFKFEQFRVHALIESAAAATLECIRRKGNKDTLRKTCDKEVIADRRLTEFLGGLDKSQFEQLFGLDADRLREGGTTIAGGKGELGTALFAAGAGMRDLRILSQRLRNRQTDLYLSGGKKQPIVKGIREHAEWIKQTVQLALAPATFNDAEIEATGARAHALRLTKERVEIRMKLTLLNQYRASLPTIDLLRTARGRLEAVADAPILSSDFDIKLEKSRKARNGDQRKARSGIRSAKTYRSTHTRNAFCGDTR